MIGDDSTHISTLVKRSDNMTAIVGTSGMHPHQADVAVRMIYTPAMGYSLPAVNVSEKVLNKIQNRAWQASSQRWDTINQHHKQSCMDPKNMEALVFHTYILSVGFNKLQLR